ncbi:hypothetical protein [Natranaeroarchaeum aerophilus]|uniref:Uncharacterized protein n=1 Tax=Natranaeroarchaeum aerophilus TaxID=2917711 RepID=A0AAE3K642_9EURY|nr:hypothetical protein [Natranaeroarchaeum aerophilus]MCL9814015.1 hypothetical protein [Natranaeroarchaeum aerophilus]
MSRIDPDTVHVDWYRNGEDEQVLIGLDGSDVKVAVAFPPDTSKRELREVFAARDRELSHYFESLARCRSSGGPQRQRSRE